MNKHLLGHLDLSRRDFSGSNLEGRNFRYCDLQGADFSGANLKNADFSYANVTGADFSHCNMEGVTMTGTLYNSERQNHMKFLAPGVWKAKNGTIWHMGKRIKKGYRSKEKL